MTTVGFDTAAAGQAAPGAVAWACTRLGFQVFPLSGGLPALTRWPERATLDEDRVREWWTGEFAGCGVGVATGAASGVWVLDIDVKGGKRGFEDLRQLVAERGGSAVGLTQTMCVRTPSGGLHLYFRWDGRCEGLRNSTGRVGAGLDVRAEGGFVRAPGQGGYRIVPRGGEARTAVAAAPEWLAEAAREASRSAAAGAGLAEATAARAAARGGMAGDGPRWAADRVRGALARLSEAGPGGRNDALNRAAYTLGLLGAGGAVSEAEAWKRCAAVMARIGARDSPEAQRRTFASGWRAGVAVSTGDDQSMG